MSTFLSIVTTLIFSGMAGWCLVRLAAARSTTIAERGQEISHLVMSLLMAVMPWSWYAAIPPMVLLGALALMWAATFSVGIEYRRRRRSPAPPAALGHLACDLLMNSAMIWMFLHMLVTSAVPGADGGYSVVSHHGSGASAGIPIPLALAAALLVAAAAVSVGGLVRASRGDGRRAGGHTGNSGAYAAMNTGMALELFSMTM